MPIRRKQVDAIVAANPPPPPKPGVYNCGYNFLQEHIIAVGNPAGTAIFDVRWERVSTLPPLKYVTEITVTPLDDTHITLACKCDSEVDGENVPIRIFAFYEI